MKTLQAVLMAGLAAAAPVVLGHHSFNAVFDGNKEINVAGVVQEFRLVNPHAEMTLEVTNADGTNELLTVEFDGRLNLIEGGWNPETIKAGERVTVHANPAHSDKTRIWFLDLTRADGTKLLRWSEERNGMIDAQRRQRAQQRARQAE